MLRDRLIQDMKDAMRAKNARKLSTVRLINAAIKERDIEMRTKDAVDRDDDAIITDILSKMVKQRRDSIQAYEEAGRCEMAEREKDEIVIIEDFLPKQMSEDEIDAVVAKVIADLDASGLKDIGRCMAALKDQYAGQMDFAKASGKVKAALS